MEYMITRDELWEQRKKVESDRQKIEARIQELKQELDKMASTSYALSGSLQTIDYFMSKTESKSTPNEPVTDNNELSESDE